MPNLRPSLLVALVLAIATAFAACGGDDEGLLTSEQANDLRSSLNNASSAVRDDLCPRARAAADSAAEKVRNLPDTIDPDLQDNLAEGFSHLTDRINAECTEQEETPTPTPTPEVTPEATETPTPEATETPTPEATPEATVEPTPTVDPGTGGASPDATATPDPDAPQRGLGDD